MQNSSNQRLAWIDLEANGLLASKCVPLEVGIIITDGNLWEVARERWLVDSRVGRTMAELVAVNDYVNAMHRDSGLLADLEAEAAVGTIKRRFEVAQSMAEFVRQYIPEGKVLLAGSSVHFDKAFLDEHFPAFSAICHHRLVDVSAFQVTLNVIRGHDISQGFGKTGNHRVFADLENSIARAALLWAVVRTQFADAP